MKLAKNILVLMCAGAMMMASTERVNALGGTYGMWMDDVTDAGMFPHHMTKWNTAWTDNGNDVNAFWKDGESTTTWGFGFGQAQHDLVNLMWANGTYGTSFGVNMVQEVEAVEAGIAACVAADGETAVAAADADACAADNATNTWYDAVDAVEGVDAATNITLNFGMGVAGGDLGFSFGSENTDIGLNFRKPMDLWLFDNMMVNFNMMGADNYYNPMSFKTSFWKVTKGEDGGMGLFGMGIHYADYAIPNKDADGKEITDFDCHDSGTCEWNEDAMTGCYAGMDEDGEDCLDALYLNYNFAMETPVSFWQMADWATFRLGFAKGFDLMNMAGTALVPSMGLGFDYGGFNLDMNVSAGVFNDPVKYFWGRNEGNLNTNFTIGYMW